jgi:hypothetical protein
MKLWTTIQVPRWTSPVVVKMKMGVVTGTEEEQVAVE